MLSGGKFANGAVTSAFQHLFNSESQKALAVAIEKGRFDLTFVDNVSEAYVDADGNRIAGRREFYKAGKNYTKADGIRLFSQSDALAEHVSALDRVVARIAIFAHGVPGATGIPSDPLTEYHWSKFQGKVIDIYLFGCNIAEGQAGLNYIQNVANWTGANVYATPYLVNYSGSSVQSFSGKALTGLNELMMFKATPR